MMRTPFFVLCLVVPIGLCLSAGTSQASPCTVKTWTIRVQKPTKLSPSGQELNCKGVIQVRGCKGLCETFERGTYQAPFLYQYHVQCTYGRIVFKDIELSECDEGYPGGPKYTVFEAASCSCRRCSSSHSNCVSLMRG